MFHNPVGNSQAYNIWVSALAAYAKYMLFKAIILLCRLVISFSNIKVY